MEDSLSYERAGVSRSRASSLIEYIFQKTRDSEILLKGSFASGILLKGLKKPVVMMSADGVGTKLILAQKFGMHKEVGIDLVAMNVNDVLATGAKPFCFVDYIATGKIDLEVLKKVIDGILLACEESGVLLVGGETAEMPDFYKDGVYDLAGFCVGFCEQEELLSPANVEAGDVILGLKSNGFHSNGFSLIRKVIDLAKIELNNTLIEQILKPTRIYVKDILSLKEAGIKLKSMAHITGGGIRENLLRIVPDGLRAILDKSSIPENPVFKWFESLGMVSSDEMFRVFNMGVGFCVIVDESSVREALSILKDAFVFGKLEEGMRDVVFV
ncbi:MAG: phosphoribosylformylglycinamidine cyclo-ligase [Aquificaceae bacterium]